MYSFLQITLMIVAHVLFLVSAALVSLGMGSDGWWKWSIAAIAVGLGGCACSGAAFGRKLSDSEELVNQGLALRFEFESLSEIRYIVSRGEQRCLGYLLLSVTTAGLFLGGAFQYANRGCFVVACVLLGTAIVGIWIWYKTTSSLLELMSSASMRKTVSTDTNEAAATSQPSSDHESIS